MPHNSTLAHLHEVMTQDEEKKKEEKGDKRIRSANGSRSFAKQ